MKNHIIAVLDRSGSMQGREKEVITGFSEMVASTLRDDSEALVTLILFDDIIETVYAARPVKEVQSLTKETYFTRGSTSLYDAIGKACTYLTSRDTTVIIITDGMENSSKEYQASDIKTLITHLEKCNWDFVYLAESMNLTKQGSDLGISKTFSYQGDVKRGYDAMSLMVSNKINERSFTLGVEELLDI